MEFISEKRKTPVVGEYDVIVVGGGPAGIGAAISAARMGANTLLVEKFGFLGGMWTAGLVNPLFDYENKGGLVQELVDRINSMGMQSSSGNMYTFDIETMKLILDRFMAEAGAHTLFHSYFADVLMEEDRVTGVLVENKGGRQAFRARVVIDCTGDGDVAARAGVPYKIGREGDGAFQPMTLMFKMNNLDYVQRYDYPYGPNGNELFDLMVRAVEREGLKDYEFNFDRPCMLRLPGAHTGVCQMTHVRGKSGVDPWELSRAEIMGRELVHEAVEFFTRYLPQFQHAQLDQTAAMIGVRESRRIQGQYEITLEDMLSGRHFEDGFCICNFNVDIHQPDGKGQEESLRYPIKPYHIPYRSLVPVKAKDLLVAGRCISGSYEAHASYRVTGDCVAMGQAAGIAAAMCADKGISPDALDGRLVVETMVRQGAKR